MKSRSMSDRVALNEVANGVRHENSAHHGADGNNKIEPRFIERKV